MGEPAVPEPGSAARRRTILSRMLWWRRVSRRSRKELDRRLARLRQAVYDAASLHDDPVVRDQFLDDLFSGRRQPNYDSERPDDHGAEDQARQ